MAGLPSASKTTGSLIFKNIFVSLIRIIHIIVTGGGLMRKSALTIGRLAFASAMAFLIFSGCSREKAKEQKPLETAVAPAADPGKEHFEKGVQYSLKGQIDDAIKEYEETIKLNPKSAEAYNNLGFALLDKGETDKAIEAQKKAIEVNPNLANGFFGLAMAYEKKGDKANAIANWKEFAKMSQPHSKWWMKAQEHIQALEGKAKPKAAKKK